MENPQIEIGEIVNPMIDVNYVSGKIVSVLERIGSQRFKSIGYKTLQEIMDAGAMGAEIIISGKVPSARARSWRFSAGYLKKSGDTAENYVLKSTDVAKLKPGIIGIRVSIMPPNVKLGDSIIIKEKVQIEKIEEEVKKPKLKKKKKKTKEVIDKEETKEDKESKKLKENGDNKEERTETIQQ